MIFAETLKCSVPSPNSVKDAAIYCVTNPTNATELWGLALDALTAVGTIGAVIVAVGLGVKSSKAAGEAEGRFRQFELEREWGQQLGPYLDQVLAITNAFPEITPEIYSDYRKHYALYSAFSIRTDSKIGGALQDLDEVIHFGIYVWGKSLGRCLHLSEWPRAETLMGVAEYHMRSAADQWVHTLTRWQYDIAFRAELEVELEKIATDLHAGIEKSMTDPDTGEHLGGGLFAGWDYESFVRSSVREKLQGNKPTESPLG